MFETVAASFVPARQDSRLKNEGDVEAALAGNSVIEAEYKVPFAAMEGHVQKITDEALQQIDGKMTTLVH